jgi:hypothetical protein
MHLRGSLVFVVLAGFASTVAAQAPAAPRTKGRVETHAGLVVLRVWGSPRERGYAHGRLLAERFAQTAIPEFTARFARMQPLLGQARAAVKRLIEYPADVQEMLDGLWQGLVDSKVDLAMPELDRTFDRDDLLVANALDVFSQMGCSSFTVWGAQVVGGGVLTARNFDWPLSGEHLIANTVVVVEHLADGRAVAAVTWPGYVGSVTGVSSDGVAVALHVGSARFDATPQPSSWPSACASRAILAHGAGDGAATFAKAKELLGYTSPPLGYLTHVALPAVPAGAAPAAVFETDSEQCVQATAKPGALVLTNHFRERQDGRAVSRDSKDREKQLDTGIGACIAMDDRQVSIDEAWRLLGTVERGGGHAFGTLHALVFRHEPWCFELRVATLGPDGLVAAPASARRHVLTRQQLFADGEAFVK